MAMATVRECMSVSAECIAANETLEQAAQKMLHFDVGAFPVCGDDDRLQGVVTDRDIVVKCLALGGDPRVMTAGELCEGTPVTIGADDDIEDAIEAMQANQLRRLPVIEDRELVGMLSQADIARNYPRERVGELVEILSA